MTKTKMATKIKSIVGDDNKDGDENEAGGNNKR